MVLDMLWLIVSTSVIGLVLLYLLGAPKRRAQLLLDKIPGPKTGYLTKGFDGSTQHLQLTKWAEEFGKIFKVNLFGTTYVVVSDPELAQKVIGTKTVDLPKYKQLYRTIDEVLHWRRWPTSFTVPQRDVYWQATRQALLRSFHRSQLREDFEVVRGKTILLIDILAGLGPGQVVDIHDACTRLALDVMGLCKFDFDFEAVESEDEALVVKLVQECLTEWSTRIVKPWHRHLGWFSEKAAKGQQKYAMFQELMDAMWHEINDRGDPPEENYTVAAQLVRLRDKPHSGYPVPPQRIFSELGLLMLKGWEHIAAAMTWTLYCLARAPAVQDKLIAELKREGISPIGERLEFASLAKLPYLEAVVREAMRLFPPSGLGTIRTPLKDMMLGDFVVPKNTPIWVHTYSMHRSARLWEGGEEFVPERWLHGKDGGVAGCSPASHDGWVTVDPYEGGPPAPGAAEDTTDEKSEKQGGKKSGKDKASAVPASTKSEVVKDGRAGGPQVCCPAAFIPFGMGPRTCPGQALARTTVMPVVALMVSALKFELVDDDSAYGSVQRLALVPADGMPLIMTPRPDYQRIMQVFKEAAAAEMAEEQRVAALEAVINKAMAGQPLTAEEQAGLEAAAAEAEMASTTAGNTMEVAGRVKPPKWLLTARQTL